MQLLAAFSLWALLYVIMAQAILAFLSVLIPNVLHSSFIVSHGAARLIEKKFASCAHIPFKHISIEPLISWMDAIAFFFASLADLFGRLFHSYEVQGLENIPSNKPALLIYFHGVLPVDMQYLPIRLFLQKGRVIRCVADRFLFFWMPLWSMMVQNYIFPGPPEKCVATLKNGHLLQISPGGAREALFSTMKYETVWNHRAGFARVAKESGVVIVPVFTRNIRQMFYIPEVFQRWLRPLYEALRLPVVPIFGGFPVKLVTYIGKPIPCDVAETPEELATVTRKAIESLITTHQTFPATITAALGERFVSSSRSHHD